MTAGGLSHSRPVPRQSHEDLATLKKGRLKDTASLPSPTHAHLDLVYTVAWYSLYIP